MRSFDNGRNVSFQLKDEMKRSLINYGCASIRVSCTLGSSKAETIQAAVDSKFLVIDYIQKCGINYGGYMKTNLYYYHDLSPTKEGLTYVEFLLL